MRTFSYVALSLVVFFVQSKAAFLQMNGVTARNVQMNNAPDNAESSLAMRAPREYIARQIHNADYANSSPPPSPPAKDPNQASPAPPTASDTQPKKSAIMRRDVKAAGGDE